MTGVFIPTAKTGLTSVTNGHIQRKFVRLLTTIDLTTGAYIIYIQPMAGDDFDLVAVKEKIRHADLRQTL